MNWRNDSDAFAAIIDVIVGTIMLWIESKLCNIIVRDEQMHTKIGNSILLAQPRCIAAGCSPESGKKNLVKITSSTDCLLMFASPDKNQRFD